MTKAQHNHNRATSETRPGGEFRWLALCGAGLLLLSGCMSDSGSLFRGSSGNAFPDVSSLALTGGGMFHPTISPEAAQADLEKGKELFRNEDYAQARTIFRRLSGNKKTPPGIAEEALFLEAECQRQRMYYPSATEIYSQLITNYPRGRFHKEALQHMFDIANYWLDETRDVMNARNEQRAGNRTFVMPVSYIHVEKSKPFLDMEGRAKTVLEKVYLNDIDGSLGEQSLFFLGNLHLFRENFTDADHFYSQIVRFHPNGQYAPRALELSIICKQLAPGGPLYDGRTIAEARDLVHQAKAAFPELAHQKQDFLERQLFAINVHQAEKDLNIAEFYRRTGYPGSAYFYYELVRRRYPGTKQAEKATQRMAELKDRVEREQHGETGNWSWLKNPFAKKSEPKEEFPPPKEEYWAPERPGGVMIGPPQEFMPQPQPYPQPEPSGPYPYPAQPEQAPLPRPVSAAPPGYGQYPPGMTPAAYYPQGTPDHVSPSAPPNYGQYPQNPPAQAGYPQDETGWGP